MIKALADRHIECRRLVDASSARGDAPLPAEGSFDRAHDARGISTIALAFADFCFRFPTPVRGHRAADIHFLLELACFAPTHIAAVTFVRFNYCSFAGFSASAFATSLFTSGRR
jgi:hypothetical protein